MKIMFSDWQIALAKERLPRQWDNGEPVEVVGTPDGWTWTLNIKLGDDLDVIPLTETDGVLGTTLKAEQLAFAGGYRIQLVGTQGEVVRHTNVVGLAVSESLSGDAQWPELPTVFSDAVENFRMPGGIFWMTGDLSYESLGAANCMLFNKDYLRDNQVEFPYQMVKDGKMLRII